MIGRRALLAGTAAGMVGRYTPGGDPGTRRRVPGGLPPPRLDQLYRPPRPPIAPGTSAGTLRARTVLISGTGAGVGLFVYNGAPALGTLADSIAAAPADDSPGNAFLGNITSYAGSTPDLAANLGAGALSWYTAPGPGGPWAIGAVIGSNQSNSLLMSSGQTAGNPDEALLQLIPGPANPTGTGGLALCGTPLQLDESDAPAAASGVTVGPRLFGSAVSGVLAFVADASKGDGGTYAAGRQSLTVSTTTAITSAVAASLPWDQGTAGLPVAAGVTYIFRAVLRAKQITAAVPDNFAITCPAVSASSALWNFMQTGASGGLDNTSATFVGSGTVGSPAYAVNDVYSVTIDGFFTPSAAGHVNITGAQSAAGDVWDIIEGSFFYIMPTG